MKCITGIGVQYPLILLHIIKVPITLYVFTSVVLKKDIKPHFTKMYGIVF